MALYDTIGSGYATFRRPDPRIAAAISAALGDASSVVNVGAGTGSYEPLDRRVFAVEPSQVMIDQRPSGSAVCRLGTAEALPFETASVDAAMAILCAHHWNDLERGLAEMARVARKRAVVLTWVPDSPSFWLTRDYFPEIVAHDVTVFPSTKVLFGMCESAFSSVRIASVPIPGDCFDGFLGAYWRRPECYLESARRQVMSSFSRFNAEQGLGKLRDDLATGRWKERNGDLLQLESLDLGYRLVCCEVQQRDGE